MAQQDTQAAATGQRITKDSRPLLDLEAVEKITTLKKSTIYKGMSDGTFPLSLKLSARAVAWKAEDIERWVYSRSYTRTELDGGAA
jgi:prophage regulatory protein